MNNLTLRQKNVLDMITAYQNDHGYTPTQKEIQEIMGFASPNTITVHLNALKKKGRLIVIPGVSRGIRLLGKLNPVQQRDEAITVLKSLLAGEENARQSAENLLERFGRSL
jgi:SOS-response transcriptional repressor LexA